LPAPFHVAALERRWFAAIALFGRSPRSTAEAHLAVARSSRSRPIRGLACLTRLLTLALLTLTLLTLTLLTLTLLTLTLLTLTLLTLTLLTLTLLTLTLLTLTLTLSGLTLLAGLPLATRRAAPAAWLAAALA
jgi:hypothetical protein